MINNKMAKTLEAVHTHTHTHIVFTKLYQCFVGVCLPEIELVY